MKKLTLWATGGLLLATVCGIVGLAHLSASIFTLTVFCAVPALIVIVVGGSSTIAREREGAGDAAFFVSKVQPRR